MTKIHYPIKDRDRGSSLWSRPFLFHQFFLLHLLDLSVELVSFSQADKVNSDLLGLWAPGTSVVPSPLSGEKQLLSREKTNEL